MDVTFKAIIDPNPEKSSVGELVLNCHCLRRAQNSGWTCRRDFWRLCSALFCDRGFSLNAEKMLETPGGDWQLGLQPGGLSDVGSLMEERSRPWSCLPHPLYLLLLMSVVNSLRWRKLFKRSLFDLFQLLSWCFIVLVWLCASAKMKCGRRSYWQTWPCTFPGLLETNSRNHSGTNFITKSERTFALWPDSGSTPLQLVLFDSSNLPLLLKLCQSRF